MPHSAERTRTRTRHASHIRASEMSVSANPSGSEPSEGMGNVRSAYRTGEQAIQMLPIGQSGDWDMEVLTCDAHDAWHILEKLALVAN
eukprot:6201433-Amphidinium_carterae.1